MPEGAFRILNWNIGGAKYLQLKSRHAHKRREGVARPLDSESREHFQASLNDALTSLLNQAKPSIVTLQEVVQSSEDGTSETIEDVLNVKHSRFDVGELHYNYFPRWLVDTRHHHHQGKWRKVRELGGWKGTPEPFFAQGNAILVREDVAVYGVWDLPCAGQAHDGGANRDQESGAQETSEAQLIENVALQPGLYFGNRDTEPREAMVAHVVLDDLVDWDGHRNPLGDPLDIMVINLHLTTLTMEREGIPRIDEEAARVRLRELDIVLNQIVSPYNRWRRECYPIRGDHVPPRPGWDTHKRHHPIWVIAGDFNFTPESLEYDAMLRSNFMDLINPAERASPTHRQHTKASGAGNTPTHTLDYIFAGPRFAAIDPAFADDYTKNNGVGSQYRVSDHYPLVYDIPIRVGEAIACRKCEGGKEQSTA